MIGYDSDGKVIIQLADATPEGQYHLITLNDDKTAILKYQCSKTSCLGEEYQGKWTLTNNDLSVTLNREHFHSLADAEFIEAMIFRINAAEMILQKTTYDQALGNQKSHQD